MKISFDNKFTQNFEEARQREWLETNGLGGWASSTIMGMNTRRYHGLLVAATRPPLGRMVMLSKLDETIVTGGNRFELGVNQYPGSIHPQGYRFLQLFEKELFPVFEYEINGIRLRKTIVAVNGENTTVVLYDVLSSSQTFVLELQPFIAARDYHRLMAANPSINYNWNLKDDIFQLAPYSGLPTLFIKIPEAAFQGGLDWYYQFEYAIEQYRGLDYHEDLFTPGAFKTSLQAGSKIGVVVSTEHPAGKDAFQLQQKEKRRRQKILRAAPVQDDFCKTLTLAADQFVVQRGKRLRTIIAGYHWFSDWGRDTMISLPGLTLVTKRFKEARQMLHAFAQHVDQGMLPNHFPDGEDKPEYNTVDATLWFFVAIYKYWQYSGDDVFVRHDMMPILQHIIDWHHRGTRYNIRVSEDGLLNAGAPGEQLTWMDARIGDWVVTPRQGKAVEINALWYNALKIYAEMLSHFDRTTEVQSFEKQATWVWKRYNQVFWNPKKKYLNDYVNGDFVDDTLRPNQLFAISLPFSLLSKENAKQVLRAVEAKLLTPLGLRTLSPDHPDYRPKYGGDQFSRDSAYHQGTVWGWLLGAYITALVRVRGATGKRQAQKILHGIETHFREAGIGSISEIFEASPPHAARGCIAQAWSVAEVLRAYMEDLKRNEFLGIE